MHVHNVFIVNSKDILNECVRRSLYPVSGNVTLIYKLITEKSNEYLYGELLNI